MNEPDELIVQAEGPPAAYPTVELGRPRLGLHGPARASAAAAQVRVDPVAGDAPARVEGDRGVQLAAGARRRHRHLARADPAPAHHDQLQAAAASARRARSCAARRRRSSSISRTGAISTPASGRWTTPTCTSAPITSSCRSTRFARTRARQGLRRGGRSHLGADGRREHDGLQLAPHRPRRRSTTRIGCERRSGNGPTHVDQTTFRSRANRENNYLLDRQVQKTETFTGIDGINTQDRAIQESMGRVVDRSKEHLGPADKAIIQARRLLLGGHQDGVRRAARRAASGRRYYTLRASEGVVPRDADWREILTPEMATAGILRDRVDSVALRPRGRTRSPLPRRATPVRAGRARSSSSVMFRAADRERHVLLAARHVRHGRAARVRRQASICGRAARWLLS